LNPLHLKNRHSRLRRSDRRRNLRIRRAGFGIVTVPPWGPLV